MMNLWLRFVAVEEGGGRMAKKTVKSGNTVRCSVIHIYEYIKNNKRTGNSYIVWFVKRYKPVARY